MFKVSVKVTPRSSKEKVEYSEDEKLLRVWTKAAPVDGKANEKTIELIANYLDVNKDCVQIASGFTSKMKIVEISGTILESDLIKRPKLL